MYLAVSILSGELDAKPAGTEIRRRFLAFLSRAPLVNLFNILLGDTTEKKWSVWNSQGRGNHEAILSWPESEEAPSAWAKVILPDPWLVDLDDVTFVWAIHISGVDVIGIQHAEVRDPAPTRCCGHSG